MLPNILLLTLQLHLAELRLWQPLLFGFQTIPVRIVWFAQRNIVWHLDDIIAVVADCVYAGMTYIYISSTCNEMIANFIIASLQGLCTERQFKANIGVGIAGACAALQDMLQVYFILNGIRFVISHWLLHRSPLVQWKDDKEW